MLKRLNNYFICDEDESDQVAISEMIFFYGISTLFFIIGVFAVIGLFKGV